MNILGSRSPKDANVSSLRVGYLQELGPSMPKSVKWQFHLNLKGAMVPSVPGSSKSIRHRSVQAEKMQFFRP